MIPIERELTKLQYYDLKKDVIEEFLLNNYERTTVNAIGNILMFAIYTCNTIYQVSIYYRE